LGWTEPVPWGDESSLSLGDESSLSLEDGSSLSLGRSLSLGFVIPKEFLNPILTGIGEVP